MKIIVQKYGGKLVEDKIKMEKVAKSIISSYKQGNMVVAVISATGNTTDELNDRIFEITNKPNQREVDVVLSSGEQIAIGLLSIMINNMGYKSISMTGWQTGILTNNKYTDANIENINTEIIKYYLNKGYIVIVAGFQGVDKNNNITTLGRGGSDTTATELAAYLEADVCEIFKDTKSIYTADPKIVTTAKKIKNINYMDMMELSKMGAKILSYKSVEYAKNHNLKLVIKSVEENEIGTAINNKKTDNNFIIVSCTKKRLNDYLDIISFIINNKKNLDKANLIIKGTMKANGIKDYIINNSIENVISIILNNKNSDYMLKQIHDNLII